MGYIRNAVLVNVPLEDLFQLTNNIRTWTELFTEYAESEVLEETPESVTFRLTTHPDENGQQWSWVSRRDIDHERKRTFSERVAPSGPFERMVIRWYYDAVDEQRAVMTWEQEFTVRPDGPVTDEQATSYLNKQTKVQQQAVKANVERLVRGNAQQDEESTKLYRGVIVGRYQAGSEGEIVSAFRKSDETELPHLIGVHTRHVWVLGDIYIHFVEGDASLPSVIRGYANHPLFTAVKEELDRYVKPLAPDLYPGVGREIYYWSNPDLKEKKHGSA